jgi:pimeloyl-ACP methyl ester carboxylesterase
MSAESAIRRRFVGIGRRTVHVRIAGRGAAVLLVHPVPGDASALQALTAALAQEVTVIAPDLAGHGSSDPLEGAPAPVDYARDLDAILDTLGIARAVVYASGASAGIALALAGLAQDRIARVILEDAWAPTDEDVATLPDWASYAAPETSGAHLLRAWDAVRSSHLFRPFHRATMATRRDVAMPTPDVLNAELVAWLRAGPRALDGLRAAGGPDPNTGRGSTPATVTRLPAGAVEHVASGILRAVREAALDSAHLHFTAAAPASHDGWRRQFVSVRDGNILCATRGEGAGRPLLALHDPAGTHALVLPFCAPLAERRPVIAVDMPGNGESDALLTADSPSARDYALVLADLLDELGVDEVDVVGRYSGGPIGMELAGASPGRVRHLVQAGITAYGAEEARRLLALYTPSVAPHADGSHLALAWHVMKSQALFWPWFDQSREGIIRGEPQLDPALIHQRVFDLLRCGDRYRQAYAALWTYPLAERLPQLEVPTLLCAPAWDPLYPHMAKAVEAGPRCRSATLPPRFDEWHRVLEPFLDDAP